MGVDVLLGGQWGDEGKAKIVDVLSSRYHIVARYQGGANAGHTVKRANKTFIFHQIPSGILSESTTSVLAHGMVVDLEQLAAELTMLEENNIDVANRLKISAQAFLVLPYHKHLDTLMDRQGEAVKIGTTKRGIGPAYMDKVARVGIRLGDLQTPEVFQAKLKQDLNVKKQLFTQYYNEPFPYTLATLVASIEKYYHRIQPYVIDSVYYLNEAYARGENILLEGAQGAGLDIDVGTYPYVTSSNTSSGGASCGSGLTPRAFQNILGVFKAYVTRVGAGALPTALATKELQHLQHLGNEFGATTGRPRQCGWFDVPQARYAIMVNGINALAVTKLDVLNSYDTIKIATHYHINGKITQQFPLRHDILERAQPVYKELPGWQNPITSDMKHYEDLPPEAQAFITTLEKLLNCPVGIISTGPERHAFIEKLPKWNATLN